MRASYFATLVAIAALFTATTADAAEMRTWTAANGGFTVEAELVALKPGDIVRLKTKDGREIDVSLAQLSAADRDYVKNPPKPGAVSPKLAKAQRAADRCRLPDEALVVYQVFHDDPQTSPAEKAIAAARIVELKDLSAKKMVRLNKQWVPAAEADAVRKQADELMRQGLELMRLDNETAFRQKFQAAAALEPEEIRAEFLAAVIYTAARAGDKALPLFQKCLARDPENVAVLNNMALLSLAKADWNAVASYWRRALELQPDQRIVHNLGRFLEQAREANISIPKSIRDPLALPYAELVASGKFESTDREVGWLFLLIEASDLDIDFRKDDEDKPKDVMPAATEDGPVVGGGTGFVVHPGYVLTNAHVAKDDATFELQLADGKLVKATRVAKAEKTDLALLKCEELTAPPMALSPTMVPRGTDVMLLGYPEMMSLGASLKATRGSISSLPDGAANDRYLYDAVTNSGNSGGPVCDDKGNVIAVHYLGINTASRYGGGIPSPKALEFLQTALPDFKPQSPHADKLDWPQVDEKVSPSTVLIWVRKKNAKAASSTIGSDLIELPVCLFCSGAGDLRCAFVGCVKGVVTRGGKRYECPSCKGKGGVDCDVCSGVGIDVQLASVQRVLARIAAAKAGGTTPTTATSSATASGPGGRVNLLNLIGEGATKYTRTAQGVTELAYEPPLEYDVFVTAQITKQGPGSSLSMGLLSSGRQFHVTIRPDGCGISVGGFIENEYEVKNLNLAMMSKMTYQFSVRRDSITVRANGNQILEYRDDQSKLSVGSWPKRLNPRHLFLACGPTGLETTEISLQPINSSSQPPTPTTTGGTPATTTPKKVGTIGKPSTNPQPGSERLGFNWRVAPAPTRRLGDAELQQAMTDLRTGSASEVARGALQFVNSVADPRYQAQVAQLLEGHVGGNEDWIRRTTVIRALETWGRPESLPVIFAAMKAKGWTVREGAMYAAVRSGHPSVPAALAERLKNPSDVASDPQFNAGSERRRIAEGLILFGPKARPEVEKLKTATDPELLGYVEQILVELGP